MLWLLMLDLLLPNVLANHRLQLAAQHWLLKILLLLLLPLLLDLLLPNVLASHRLQLAVLLWLLKVLLLLLCFLLPNALASHCLRLAAHLFEHSLLSPCFETAPAAVSSR
jgi:hypothetical protein